MASKPAQTSAEHTADQTAQSIASVAQPAEHTAHVEMATRAPSKTRHLSAMRSQKLDTILQMVLLSANGKDDATKNAGMTLARQFALDVQSIDEQIAKIQAS